MELIGIIARLQVQRSSLKVGEPPFRRYDPAPVLAVPALTLSPAGAVGQTAEGEVVVDVHHRDHPASKNRAGANVVSLGFTSHYALMRRRFGEHVRDGLAGENILIATEGLFAEADLAGGLVVETADGALARLERIVVAEPCVEFTRHAMRFPDGDRADRRVTEALDFLRGGVRGFYATLAAPAEARVRVGDRVYLP